MKLSLKKESYIKTTHFENDVFSVVKEFIIEQELFDSEFIFKQHLNHYINYEFKSDFLQKINQKGYIEVGGFLITYEKVCPHLYKILFLE